MSQAEIITTEALEELEREQFLRELLDGAPIRPRYRRIAVGHFRDGRLVLVIAPYVLIRRSR